MAQAQESVVKLSAVWACPLPHHLPSPNLSTGLRWGRACPKSKSPPLPWSTHTQRDCEPRWSSLKPGRECLELIAGCHKVIPKAFNVKGQTDTHTHTHTSASWSDRSLWVVHTLRWEYSLWTRRWGRERERENNDHLGGDSFGLCHLIALSVKHQYISMGNIRTHLNLDDNVLSPIHSLGLIVSVLVSTRRVAQAGDIRNAVLSLLEHGPQLKKF